MDLLSKCIPSYVNCLAHYQCHRFIGYRLNIRYIMIYFSFHQCRHDIVALIKVSNPENPNATHTEIEAQTCAI